MNIRNPIVILLGIAFILNCSNTANKTTITIPDGKVGMIGYGSLMSLKKTEELLGRAYSDDIYRVHLEGFQRTWDFVASNNDPGGPEEAQLHDGYYIRANDTLKFNSSIFLNITENNSVSINCVLYFLTEEELKAFDIYEYGYERIDVTDRIAEHDFKGGEVYAYRALPEYQYDMENDVDTLRGISVIHEDYVDLVERACDSIGNNFRREYDTSTLPFDPDLVAPVIWKKVR